MALIFLHFCFVIPKNKSESYQIMPSIERSKTNWRAVLERGGGCFVVTINASTYIAYENKHKDDYCGTIILMRRVN